MSTTDQMPEQAGQAEQLQGEFKRLVLDGKLDPKLTDDLTQLVSAGFCTHRSWGFGKITTVDTLLAKITIDFQSKPNHVMDLGFAAKILSPLSADHILARKASDLSGLKRMGALDHLQLIKLVLTSYGGQATLAQIQEALVPDVIDEDWKKWWADAKKEMKGDGHFQLPVKKSEPLIYHADELSAYDQLMSNLRDSKGLKAQLAAATEIYKGIGDVENKEEALGEIIDVLNLAIKNHINIKPSLSLEAILLRDAIHENSGLSPSEDAPVSGGEPGAIEGTLAIMTGGNSSDFERAKPIFDVLGASSVLCGDVGAGNFTKLANQMIVGANIHILAEALTLTTKAGLDPETVFNAIKGGLAGSNVMNTKAPMMYERNFKPGFRIELHLKDITNAMETANELQLPLQVTSNLHQVLKALVIEGNGKDDHSGILKFVENQSGVEVKK